MITKVTVQTLRTVWADVQPVLMADLDRINQAMAKADKVETWRTLQGQANAIRKMIRLPEELEQLREDKKDG